MTTNYASLIKQAGWAGLSTLLVGFGQFFVLPYVRSEAAGLYWPDGVQIAVAAASLFLGLALSRRAGWAQYVVFALAAVFLALQVWAAGAAMEAAGVTGVEVRS